MHDQCPVLPDLPGPEKPASTFSNLLSHNLTTLKLICGAVGVLFSMGALAAGPVAEAPIAKDVFNTQYIGFDLTTLPSAQQKNIGYRFQDSTPIGSYFSLHGSLGNFTWAYTQEDGKSLDYDIGETILGLKAHAFTASDLRISLGYKRVTYSGFGETSTSGSQAQNTGLEGRLYVSAIDLEYAGAPSLTTTLSLGHVDSKYGSNFDQGSISVLYRPYKHLGTHVTYETSHNDDSEDRVLKIGARIFF